ncbi:MAG TPA: ATP-binding SpoIIE family protein phosphatase [Bryobacteraceae bacterium]|nr:ATP-binding SpoIIE family protein phosphatase [Bryobacteraceae bacterium]
MSSSFRIPIDEVSQIAEARRVGLRLADEIGFDDVRAGQVAIVVTEMCTNILKHAQSGAILLQVPEAAAPEGGPQLELLSLDKGPGMYDVERCIEDGFTSGSSPGEGLGAVRRLAGESDFYSIPGEGTAILARWPAAPPARTAAPVFLRAGAVNANKVGEEFCGDAWGIEQDGGAFSVMVADGLGHGFEAAQASREAIRILRNNKEKTPGSLIDLVHRALRGLRGAAVAVARIDLDRALVTFSGLGNILAQIYAGSARYQHLVSVNGTAGHHAGRIREFSYPWPKDGLLVMHSDGLATGTAIDSHSALPLRDPALIAGVLYRDFARHHDDATVVVAKAA